MDLNTLKTNPFHSHNDAETEAFASSLAQQLPKGSVIALHGNLGTGKTVFARGFARGLGITEPVSSPTYTIIQEYPIVNGYLYHMDLYRINDSAGALGFGIDEFLNDPTSYALLEWPERIADILPSNTIHLQLTRINEDEREITIIN